MGAVREFSEAVGDGSDIIGKVLTGGVPGSATFCGRDIGAVVSNALKYQGGARGIHMTGDGDEGAKSRGRDLEKVGARQVYSGGRN